MTGDTTCPALPSAVVAAYGEGLLDGARAWSVEAHLPGCPACRKVLRLAASGDEVRLTRNRAVVLTRLGLAAPGPARRLLRRCGVPGHVLTLLAAMPSLRRSWLAGVLAVLAVVTAAAQLASWAEGPRPDGWGPLVPFLAIAPLLPLAAVAAAFSPALDPAYRLSAAAPVSAVWLLCVRSAAVALASLVPVTLAALALPGPWWLAVALLLPSLALCAVALALAAVIPPLAAVTATGASWLVVVVGLTVAAGQPGGALGPAGQFAAAAVLAAGLAAVALRRDRIDYGGLG